jgi:CBS domain-containing protein
MRVRDIMSHPVHTVRPDDAIEVAAELLTRHAIAAAPVVADGRLVAMVSEGDLLRRRVPTDPTAHAWPPVDDPGPRPHLVAEVMSRDVVTAWPAEDVADVARTMLTANLRSIPVLAGGELVGIVSRRDLLRTVVRTDEVLRHEIQHRLDEYAGGEPRWTVAVVDGIATVHGDFDDPTENQVIPLLVRTVPGVGAVHVHRGATTRQPVQSDSTGERGNG